MRQLSFLCVLALYCATALLATVLLANDAYAAGNRFLHYRFNQNVVITISNVACPIPEVKQRYDFAVAASRIDGAKLIGCYRKLDEDRIEIQWYKGDKTVLPANVFLVDPDKPPVAI